MKISKALIDANLRTVVFNAIGIANIEGFHKINDRQFGCIVEDMNGDRRYIRVGCIVEDVNGDRRYARVGVIVAEQREDITADELMASEIADYEDKQAKKAAKAAERAEKAAKDKKLREERKKNENENK